MDDYSNAHWGHFGRRLVASRGRRTVAAVAEASGISEKSIGNFEKDRERPKEPTSTMYALVDFYGWTPDSLDRVLLERGYPTYESSADPIAEAVRRLETPEVRSAVEESAASDATATPGNRRLARKAVDGK